MPPPSNHPAFNLKVLTKMFFVKQLRSSEIMTGELLETLNTSRGFFSITRTPEEVSIVGEIDDKNDKLLHVDSGDWRCIQIAGSMNFGVLFYCVRVKTTV
jgi:hypothetical protein